MFCFQLKLRHKQMSRKHCGQAKHSTKKIKEVPYKSSKITTFAVAKPQNTN